MSDHSVSSFSFEEVDSVTRKRKKRKEGCLSFFQGIKIEIHDSSFFFLSQNTKKQLILAFIREAPLHSARPSNSFVDQRTNPIFNDRSLNTLVLLLPFTTVHLDNSLKVLIMKIWQYLLKLWSGSWI
ncbi:hypothetical protein F8M41_003632 [Gigaspora margarita]|uniref:Uncharacterized protein n=1 Tax=Gigaspora margarita TaxID=4874 RepID=A0A8H4A8B7_GIGMA|nr:hypothetical protein F8M41_003632 [Gigaspora margarita]